MAEAAVACAAAAGCGSFALLAGGPDCTRRHDPGPAVEYHLYRAAAGYTPVPNSDWVAYTKPPGPPGPLPPPPPPPPPADPLVQAMRCGVRQLAVETAAARVGKVFGQRVVGLASAALRIDTECPGYGVAAVAPPATPAGPRSAPPSPRRGAGGPATEVHISVTGSDVNGDGSAGRPFASPVRARDAIRARRRQRARAPGAAATVWVHPGKLAKRGGGR